MFALQRAKNVTALHYTDAEVELAISNCLHCAVDREGGRKRRCVNKSDKPKDDPADIM